MPEEHEVICPDCGAAMVLKTSSQFKYNDGEPKKFYSCSNYPSCKGSHGAHPDGRPLGKPASREVRELRIKLHELLATQWNNKNANDRRRQYDWMRFHAPTTHVSEMDKEQIEQTIKNFIECYGEPKNATIDNLH